MEIVFQLSHFLLSSRKRERSTSRKRELTFNMWTVQGKEKKPGFTANFEKRVTMNRFTPNPSLPFSGDVHQSHPP